MFSGSKDGLIGLAASVVLHLGAAAMLLTNLRPASPLRPGAADTPLMVSMVKLAPPLSSPAAALAPRVPPRPSAPGGSAFVPGAGNGRVAGAAAITPAVASSAMTSATAAAPDPADIDRYQAQLRAHIARFQHYPPAARGAGIVGTPVVGFSLRRNGSLGDLWLEQGSGAALLDEEALATIRRAVPLPGVPGDLPDELTVTLPIQFALDAAP